MIDDHEFSWSFHQLRCFTEYKSLLRGVSFVLVDPRWTSQACSCCGFVDRGNRKTPVTPRRT
jgi:transposase